MLFKSIMDHKSTEKYVKKSDGYINRNNREPKIRKAKKGWQYLIEWADGMITWEILSDIKKSLTAQVSEYTRWNGII